MKFLPPSEMGPLAVPRWNWQIASSLSCFRLCQVQDLVQDKGSSIESLEVEDD
jgi:hypothetical protein